MREDGTLLTQDLGFMNSNSNKPKFPAAEFLALKKSDFESLGEQASIQWEFSAYKSPFQMHIISCEMTGFSKNSKGTGVHWDKSKAIVLAFAEAWERLWYLKEVSVIEKSTSGMAAGSTLQMAQKNASEELIERVVLLSAWREQKGWRKGSGLSMKEHLLLIALRLQGWRIDFFDLSSDIGDVRVILGRHAERGALFDSCFKGVGTAEKLLLSFLRMMLVPVSRDINEFPEQGSPIDHLRFYANPKHLEAFEFIETVDPKPIEIGGLESLEVVSLVEPSQFPAVARASNKAWPKLTWGKSSIQGNNPWPHPLA